MAPKKKAVKKVPSVGLRGKKKRKSVPPSAGLRPKKKRLRLKEGKSYESEDGTVHGPMKAWEHYIKPTFYDRDGNGLWYPNGKRHSPAPGETKWDLVREVAPVVKRRGK